MLTIGRGSNLLVADSGFPGIVVSLAEFAGGIAVGSADRDGRVVVTAGGGVALAGARPPDRRGVGHRIRVGGRCSGIGRRRGADERRRTRLRHGRVPSSTSTCSISTSIVDAGDRAGTAAATLDASDLGLRFRGSDLTDDQLVVEVRLDLRRGDREASERQIAEIVRWRREHQPGGQNCGSVFVNPVPGEVTAGGLIDGLGLRGLRIGTAWVSEKHANFIQASDGGSAADVRAVMEDRARPGRGGDRVRHAQRGPTGRLRRRSTSAFGRDAAGRG